jgi:hypothetical protein
MEPDIELTELYDLDVERHDAVEHPASGFSFLVTKSAAAPAEPPTKVASGTVSKAEFDALSERVAKAESRADEAERALAVLKATPLPGGPHLGPSQAHLAYRSREEAVEKAAHHRRRAQLSIGDKELSDYHTAKAAEYEAVARR